VVLTTLHSSPRAVTFLLAEMQSKASLAELRNILRLGEAAEVGIFLYVPHTHTFTLEVSEGMVSKTFREIVK
jgi:hypothetical protein